MESTTRHFAGGSDVNHDVVQDCQLPAEVQTEHLPDKA
jgi:hypothetical protein